MVQKHNLDNFIVMFKSYKHNISCVRTMGQSLVSCILILMARDSQPTVKKTMARDTQPSVKKTMAQDSKPPV